MTHLLDRDRRDRMPTKYMTVREAATRLRVHDRTIRRWMREGLLTKYTIETAKSHSVRADADEVEARVAAQAPEPCEVGR
jgi:excisionase family DNA binding protein